ncbi:hypothetical protein M758_2G053700 [Ceratodon purpureus]|uniref:Protein YIP n=1 Tax=Ceratodon purpureus TaxID=3225 RepID=A0A8T0IT75_CERPU|nr:hypothetical protein KC19_2G054400 [Ceratodon purpureus]KAG0625422.1 hypothetical protein M758_2G053700 [Ceratodon purpureus]
MSNGYHSLGNEIVSGSVPVAASSDRVLQFQESNLQTFPPNDTRGKLVGSFQPPGDADDSFSKPGSGSQAGLGGSPAPSGWQSYFSVVSYRPYFNVDTSEVVERIRDSLFPFKGDFVEKTSHNPDMYGPFWICSTLVFVTAALGNFAAYLSTNADSWHYDVNKVSWAAFMFYGYVGVIPLGLYFLLKYLGVVSGLVQLWCLYGYSLFVFIPASFLCVVPWDIMRWVVVGVAGVMSAGFLAINIRTHIKTASERWFLIVTSSAAIQLGLALVLKLYFFTYFYHDSIVHV